MLSTPNRPFTLHKMINLFIFTFLILANSIQYANNSNVLTFNLSFNAFDYRFFQIIILIILILYNILYKSSTFINYNTNAQQIEILSTRIVLISIISTILILIYFNFNIPKLFFRGFTDELIESNHIQRNQIESLIFNKFIRSIPWACFIAGYLSRQPKKIIAILFILMLITVFPSGLDRNATATYWIAVVILFLKKYLTGFKFIYLILIGLFVIFPFLENFRHYDGSFHFNFDLAFLDSMHFDASQIFMATIKTNTVTFGNQLLGVLLFWIPRSIWPTKPVGSGHYLVSSINDGAFNNVSMPYFSEGFINFGYIGILIFIYIMAVFCAKFDAFYWKNKLRSIKDGYYLLSLGAVFFIMRGDLMSSTAYSIGIVCAYYFVIRLTTKKNNKSNYYVKAPSNKRNC